MSKCLIVGTKCPETSDRNAKAYCPWWKDEGEMFVMKNSKTGEERIEQCGARVMVQGQMEVIKASNRPAAVMESTRNEIADGFTKVATVMGGIIPALENKDGKN